GMRIAICDDNKQSQSLFLNVLNELEPNESAECFFDGASLLKEMRERPTFDIIFLDIYLPGENGIDIAGEIRKISPRTGIVFITNSLDFAVDAYSLNALHYLVKPVTKEGVEECFLRLKSLRSKPRSILLLNVGRDSITVGQDEIIYILSAGHAKEICLINNQIYRIWVSLEELESKLDDNFLKINRGTIANMEHIRQMSADYCLMDNGARLDFSRRKRADIMTVYDAWLFSHLAGNR
ncbi:MAG: LytTR family DNA-binding domain-containing protein, partial [Lachnospiraceae bacterium]|nr:LytTR family DNA-binding domain-containing protein [Lachnospiraceae bacterium]